MYLGFTVTTIWIIVIVTADFNCNTFNTITTACDYFADSFAHVHLMPFIYRFTVHHNAQSMYTSRFIFERVVGVNHKVRFSQLHFTVVNDMSYTL